MSITALQQAAIQRIIDIFGAPNIGLPNRPAPPKPRWVVQIGTGANRTLGMNGSTERRQDIVVLVEVDDDEFAGFSDELVQTLADAFPVNLRFGGGYVPVMPSPRAPIYGDGTYSVPVVIELRAYI